jgi:hypothetical protein
MGSLVQVIKNLVGRLVGNFVRGLWVKFLHCSSKIDEVIAILVLENSEKQKRK